MHALTQDENCKGRKTKFETLDQISITEALSGEDEKKETRLIEQLHYSIDCDRHFGKSVLSASQSYLMREGLFYFAYKNMEIRENK